MAVKNEVRTVRGLFVNANAAIGAEKVEFPADNQSVFDILNSLIGADHGTVIAVSDRILLWVDEDATLRKKSANIKLSMLAGQPVYGNGVMIGYEHTEDDQGTRFVNLPSEIYNHLIGH